MRIVTKKINTKLSYELKLLIWNFYDEGYQNIAMDDYQFFKIEQIEGKTKLKMWQEEPRAIKVKTIPHFEECEVWIINDGNVVTMLFPEEY